MSGKSAWDQWGSKRPTGLNGATQSISNLLKSTPLSSSVSSMASTVSSSGSGSDSEGSNSFSLKRMWDSAQEMAKNAAANGKSFANGNINSSSVDLESGAADGTADGADGDANVSSSFPFLGRRTASPKANSCFPVLSWQTRFKLFVAMTLMSLVFFGMASMFLPMLVIRPSKFALSFTLGSTCFMTAFAMLKGPGAYLASLFQRQFLVVTTLYFVSLGLTLYSCLVLGSYVMVIFSSVLQLCTLASFAFASLPGGGVGLKAFGKVFVTTTRKLLVSIGKLFAS